jgi:hypothetical protein
MKKGQQFRAALAYIGDVLDFADRRTTRTSNKVDGTNAVCLVVIRLTAIGDISIVRSR